MFLLTYWYCQDHNIGYQYWERQIYHLSHSHIHSHNLRQSSSLLGSELESTRASTQQCHPPNSYHVQGDSGMSYSFKVVDDMTTHTHTYTYIYICRKFIASVTPERTNSGSCDCEGFNDLDLRFYVAIALRLMAYKLIIILLELLYETIYYVYILY